MSQSVYLSIYNFNSVDKIFKWYNNLNYPWPFFYKIVYTHIGGVEKHVVGISKILVKKGHSMTVLIEKGFGWVEKQNWSNLADAYSGLWKKYEIE